MRKFWYTVRSSVGGVALAVGLGVMLGRQSFGTTSNHAFGEVLVRPDGAVIARSGSLADFSLNGIDFRTTN